jgi:hypothetical protein
LQLDEESIQALMDKDLGEKIKEVEALDPEFKAAFSEFKAAFSQLKTASAEFKTTLETASNRSWVPSFICHKG